MKIAFATTKKRKNLVITLYNSGRAKQKSYMIDCKICITQAESRLKNAISEVVNCCMTVKGRIIVL